MNKADEFYLNWLKKLAYASVKEGYLYIKMLRMKNELAYSKLYIPVLKLSSLAHYGRRICSIVLRQLIQNLSKSKSSKNKAKVIHLTK